MAAKAVAIDIYCDYHLALSRASQAATVRQLHIQLDEDKMPEIKDSFETFRSIFSSCTVEDDD